MTTVKKRVKIISDGTRFGTRVCVDGEPLEGVSRIEWVIDSAGGDAKARIDIHDIGVDVESELLPFGHSSMSLLLPKDHQ